MTAGIDGLTARHDKVASAPSSRAGDRDVAKYFSYIEHGQTEKCDQIGTLVSFHIGVEPKRIVWSMNHPYCSPNVHPGKVTGKEATGGGACSGLVHCSLVRACPGPGNDAELLRLRPVVSRFLDARVAGPGESTPGRGRCRQLVSHARKSLWSWVLHVRNR